MFLVPSKANMRSADPILPLKIKNATAFNGFLVAVGCFRALFSRTTIVVLSCAPQTRRHAGCDSYYRHMPLGLGGSAPECHSGLTAATH